MEPVPFRYRTLGRLTVVTVSLERLGVDHAEEMWPLLADPSLYEFTGGAPPSRDALAERYRAQVAGSGRAGERWHNWIVRRADTGEAVGFVQATVVGSTADIAWVVGVAHQGRGFAGSAVRAMVAELTASGVDRFSAHIHPEHRRSQGVAAAVGLSRSGEVDDDGEEIWSGPARPA